MGVQDVSSAEAAEHLSAGRVEGEDQREGKREGGREEGEGGREGGLTDGGVECLQRRSGRALGCWASGG